jgi:hypothetical protein
MAYFEPIKEYAEFSVLRDNCYYSFEELINEDIGYAFPMP